MKQFLLFSSALLIVTANVSFAPGPSRAPSLAFISEKDSLPPHVYHWDSLTTIIEDTRARKEIMEGSSTSLSHFEGHASTLQPGKAPHPPHTHADEEELIIVKEGKLKITIGGASAVLGPGSVAYAIPGDEHGIVNVGNSQAT